jgi:cytosine/adenosine deaminase-related metal-dependent hydrolase
MLLARLATWADPQPDFLPGRLALELATRGGARVLGRPDLGSLEPGRCADFIGVDLDRIEFAGALHDPVAALVFCSPARVDHAYVHGRAVVADGRLVHLDERRLIADHNRAARRLAEGE